MKDYLIIYNPISGRGVAKRNINKIKSMFYNKNIKCSIKESQYKGQITELCKNSENYCNIIIVGGDGKVGIGTSSPTSLLHIHAVGSGVAATASLHIESDGSSE